MTASVSWSIHKTYQYSHYKYFWSHLYWAMASFYFPYCHGYTSLYQIVVQFHQCIARDTFYERVNQTRHQSIVSFTTRLSKFRGWKHPIFSVNILSQIEEKVALEIVINDSHGSSKFHDTLVQNTENRHLAKLSVSHLMKCENGIKLPFWDVSRKQVSSFLKALIL